MTKKLAVFDIDGTIADHGQIPQSVLEGLKSLRKNSYITTLSTGRAYLRVKHSFNDILNELISPDALLITEHGTKIVDVNGDVIFAEYFNKDDIEHIIDFVRANQEIFTKIAFFYPEIDKKPKVWCIDEESMNDNFKYTPDKFDFFRSSFTELKEILLATKVSNIKVVLYPHVKVQNLKLKLTRSQTVLNFQDGFMEFMKNNTNKGIAVSYLKKHYGITDENLLVAGNAINDQEMLNTPARTRILVGTGDERDTVMGYLFEHEKVTCIDTPESLGHFLQSIE